MRDGAASNREKSNKQKGESNMKVTLKHRLGIYQGECDDLVYYYNSKLKTMVARRYTKPRSSESNDRLAANSKHLKALNPSEAYVSDLKLYLLLYNSQLKPGNKPINNHYALYTRLMYEQARALGITVTDLTRDLIGSVPLPCRSGKSAVEAGLLDAVEGYERLDRLI